MTLVRFMESRAGRLARGSAGVALIGLGAWLGTAGATAWWLLAVVGLVPIAASVAHSCLVAPLAGAPVRHTAHTD